MFLYELFLAEYELQPKERSLIRSDKMAMK